MAGLGLLLTTGSSDWLSVIFSIALSHYLLAIWYARRRFVTIARQPASIAILGGLLAGTYLLYTKGFPLSVYFAMHHAFNEAYLRNQRLSVDVGQSTVFLRSSAVFMHFSGVLLIIDNAVRTNYEPLLWALFIPSVIIWLYALSRHWRKMNNSQRLDQVMLELILLVLLPIAQIHSISLVEVIGYHVVFWGLYPLIGLVGRQQQWPLVVYLALSVISIGGFVAISPIGLHGVNVPVALFYSQFIVWSWLHITLAMATSSAHPQWITRWFAPRLTATAG